MKSSFRLALLMIAVLGVGFGLGSLGLLQNKPKNTQTSLLKEKSEVTKKAIAKAKQDGLDQEWAILPAPPEPEYGKVEVPKTKIIPLPVSGPDMNGFVSEGSDLDRQLRKQTMMLLTSNLDPDVQKVAQAIDNKEVVLRFGAMPPEVLATYSLWPKDNRVTATPRSREEYVPQILISANFASGAGTPDDVLTFYSVIVHEFAHHQFAMTGGNWEFFVAKPNVMNTYLDEKSCQTFWDVEYDGYLAGSKTGVRIGLRNDFTRRVGDEKAFRQMVFLNARNTYLLGFPECSQVWAKNAGHEKPASFANAGAKKKMMLENSAVFPQ